MLTEYKDFVFEEDEDSELPCGRFGCPFLDYSKENIGSHYFELNEINEYEEYFCKTFSKDN